jgi:hypothetical protein
MSEQKTWADKLAKFTRVILLGAIATVVLLLIVAKQNGSPYPLSMDYAHANGIASSPGFLALNVGKASEVFYLIDTNKQVLCVYKLTGGSLRLVSARKFDSDSDIPEDSVVVTAGGKTLKLSGTDGLDRASAKDYADGIKKMIEAAQAKKK